MPVGTIVGTRRGGGYDLAATDFLTEARIRNAKPKGHPYKLRDGGGLWGLDQCELSGASATFVCSVIQLVSHVLPPSAE